MGSDRVAPIYLPFSDGKSILSMGLSPLSNEAWLDFDKGFAADLARKRELLQTRHGEVFRALPEAQAAATELLRCLATHLAQHQAAHFRVEGPLLVNRATDEVWDIAVPALHPLDIAGRLVSEDICLLQLKGARHILTGASLCSPARWRLGDKIGQPLAAIHDPVPGYADALERKVDQFMAALKPGRLFCRFNWGIADDPTPFQPATPPPAPAVAADQAGEKLWLRVERQTLRRLPETGAIVFTIRTYITRLDRAIVSADSARDLAAALRDMEPAMQHYKNIAGFLPALLLWLDRRQPRLA